MFAVATIIQIHNGLERAQINKINIHWRFIKNKSKLWALINDKNYK